MPAWHAWMHLRINERENTHQFHSVLSTYLQNYAAEWLYTDICLNHWISKKNDYVRNQQNYRAGRICSSIISAPPATSFILFHSHQIIHILLNQSPTLFSVYAWPFRIQWTCSMAQKPARQRARTNNCFNNYLKITNLWNVFTTWPVKVVR